MDVLLQDKYEVEFKHIDLRCALHALGRISPSLLSLSLSLVYISAFDTIDRQRRRRRARLVNVSETQCKEIYAFR